MGQTFIAPLPLPQAFPGLSGDKNKREARELETSDSEKRGRMI